MNKKEKRLSARQAAEKAVIRDEQNRRLAYAATNPIKDVLNDLHTALSGLDMESVSASRIRHGSNKVTHVKKKSLARRLADAFINPFTAILFFLALVSTATDMVFPYFSLFGSVPEDFACLTVVIIMTMVVISGTLRFVQESRSGNAAEKLLAMITTTCTVTRKNQEIQTRKNTFLSALRDVENLEYQSSEAESLVQNAISKLSLVETYEDAATYKERLQKAIDRIATLPTESEWQAAQQQKEAAKAEAQAAEQEQIGIEQQSLKNYLNQAKRSWNTWSNQPPANPAAGPGSSSQSVIAAPTTGRND